MALGHEDVTEILPVGIGRHTLFEFATAVYLQNVVSFFSDTNWNLIP